MREGAVHPSAEMLSAFAEHALLPRERAEVLAHLAECGDCRDVMFAASAAREEETWEQRRERRGGVRRWWLWAGAPVAVAALVAAGVAVRQVQRPVPVLQARYESPKPPPMGERSSSEVGEEASKRRPPARARVGVKSESAARGDIGQSAKASVEVASETAPVEVEGAAQQSARTSDAAKAGVGAPAMRTPQPKPAAKGDISQALATGTTAEFAGAVAGNAPARMSYRKAFAVSRRWRISERGALEWSDGADVWQAEKRAGKAPFQAVATIGSEVWAFGESGGAHSRDGGVHWLPVRIGDGAREMSGRVTAVSFVDARHGTVTSSSGERWTTSDGGASWRREP